MLINKNTYKTDEIKSKMKIEFFGTELFSKNIMIS